MRLTATCAAALAAVTMTAGAAELRISGPYTRDNLSIYLVHGKDRIQKTYLTLAEAVAQRKVVVHETGSVNILQIENLSMHDVYIQSGEIVKGGKQDRVLKDDIIIPSSSGKVDISAFCVESGRWTQRGSESARAFAASPNAIASPAMKRAVREKGDQGAVWAQVAAEQDSLTRNLGGSVKSQTSASSYQLTLEAPKVRQMAEGFKSALAELAAKNPDALGYVMAVNGKVTGADVYATHALFAKLWPKLLDSAAVEAMSADRRAGMIAPAPMEDVRAAATGYGARVRDEKQINKRTNGVKAELPQGLVFETKDAEASGGPVHRSYVTK